MIQENDHSIFVSLKMIILFSTLFLYISYLYILLISLLIIMINISFVY